MTQLLGILNITPDSFSDGGQADSVERALEAVERLLQDGADGIDIGAESTRPGAIPLAPHGEWARLAPILPEAVRRAHAEGRIVSVDTRHAETAEKALALGVDWINDVGGLSDARMIAAVRDSHCRLVAMHSLSVPADPQITLPETSDPVAVVRVFFVRQMERLDSAGIGRDRLILDPGIGFGKNARQSLHLVLRAAELTPGDWLVGHSRKSFLNLFGERPAAHRDDLTLAFSAMLAMAGVSWLRVHDVARHRQLLSKLSC